MCKYNLSHFRAVADIPKESPLFYSLKTYWQVCITFSVSDPRPNTIINNPNR